MNDYREICEQNGFSTEDDNWQQLRQRLGRLTGYGCCAYVVQHRCCKREKVAVENRDIAAGKLSSSDIVKAQQMAKRCVASGYKDCD